MTKEQTQDLIKVAGTAFAVFSVVKTIRDARNDSDGLQLAEALLRGATLALSVAIIVRNLRQRSAGELPEGVSPA